MKVSGESACKEFYDDYWIFGEEASGDGQEVTEEDDNEGSGSGEGSGSKGKEMLVEKGVAVMGGANLQTLRGGNCKRGINERIAV